MLNPYAKKLFLVDDNPFFLKILGHAFGNAGFECTLCISAAEAIANLNLDIPDVILSDYEMPDMNGIEFRKFLIKNADFKNIPFVFLSYITDKELMAEGLDLQAVDYVVKETPVNVIVSKINNLIDTVQKQRELSVLEIKKAAIALNIRTVPHKAPVIDGFGIDFWHRAFQDIPGGDFIDFIQIDNLYSFIILGDVMGKKWLAWFFTFTFLSYIRAAIRFGIPERNFSTAGILEKVNLVICHDNALKDILSTLTLLMIDNKTRQITYSGAGDLPLLHYKARSKEFVQLESTGLLLGLLPDGNYTQQQIDLDSGDQLFIFTDGLIDYEDENQKKSDYKLFKDKLAALLNNKIPFSRIKTELFQNPAPGQVDDCSIINIHKL